MKKKQWMTKMLAFILCMAIVITSVSMPSLASEAGETASIAETAETEQTEAAESETLLETQGTESWMETELDSETVETAASDTEAVIENVADTESLTGTESQAETENVQHRITGFVPLSDGSRTVVYSYYGKPSEAEVISELPQTLEVYLDGESESQQIPVTWKGIGDFDDTEFFYYQFDPVWNENIYILDTSERIPYIGVYLSASKIRSVSNNENETIIYEYLTQEMGLNMAAACGVLANIECESDFNPNIYGDSGSSYGICQWHNTRFTALKEYTDEWDTLEGQLAYLNYELTEKYPSVLAKLKSVANSAQGAYDAAYYWCYYFEVPANTAAVSATRGNLAVDTYWPYYAGTVESIVTTMLNVKSAACTGFQITVQWDSMDSVDIDGYYVYRKTADSGWKGISPVSAGITTYVDTTAQYGVEYSYTVRAYKIKSGQFYLSDFNKTGLKAKVSPSAPVITATCLDYQNAQMEWTAIAGADNYALYLLDEKTGKWSYSTRVNGTSYALKTKCGQKYTYTVRACKNENGKTVLSDFDRAGVSFYTVPDAPVLKSAVSENYNSVTISWEAAKGAQKYCVYRRTAGTGFKLIGMTDKLTYTDSDVVCGTAYIYTVRAYTAVNGNKALSDFDKTGLKVTPIPDTPVLKTISGRDYENINVKWSAVEGAQSYYIYRREVGGKWAMLGHVSESQKVNYVDTTADAGKVYVYTVRACRVESGKKILSNFDTTGTYWIDYPRLDGAVSDTKGITVQWQEIDGADGYCIYRKVNGGSWKLLTKLGGDGTSYQDTDVSAGNHYLYTVRAYCIVNKKYVLSDFDRNGCGGTK